MSKSIAQHMREVEARLDRRCRAKAVCVTPYDHKHHGPLPLGTRVYCSLPQGHTGPHISWREYIAWRTT